MKTHVELRSGAYADSVTLLQVSRDVAAVDGVQAAQVAMATPLNVEVLGGMGFDVPPASPNDMVVALRADDDAALERGLAAVGRGAGRRRPAPVRPIGPGRPPHHRRGAARHSRRAGARLHARAPARPSRRWTPSTPAAT